MSDPHTPTLEGFILTADEQAGIEAALISDDPWDHDAPVLAAHRAALISVKDRLASLHSARQGGTCCYCRILIGQHGPLMRDREHILPKSRYKKLTYAPYNLSIACKRCNMSVKRSNTDFVVDPDTIENAATSSDRYRFVHPNFDIWEDHLIHRHEQSGAKAIVHYAARRGSAKGQYTYDYFRLRELTVQSFDEAQGGKETDAEIQAAVTALEKSMNP